MTVPPFTDEQERAIAWRGGSLLLSANAGSGKTAVLTERFARAVLEDGVAPSRILAITFTERAAGELRRRVRERLMAAGALEAARDTEGALIATIHGFCAQLLRGAPLAAGVDPRFSVLDEASAESLRGQAFRAALADLVERHGAAAVELLAAQGIDVLAGEVMGAYDGLRSRGLEHPSLPEPAPRAEVAAEVARLRAAAAGFAAELALVGSPGAGVLAALETLEGCDALAAAPSRGELLALRVGGGGRALATPAAEAYEDARLRCLQACDDAEAARLLPLLEGLLRGFGEHYEQLKQARGALDFDDLELRARSLLLGDEALRRRWSERFELIMVDELQDTNARQMELLEALERDNALCVGDEFQSIYGFRHADVQIFRARRDGGGASLALSMNFRSRPEVIDAVNATFAARFGEGYIALVAGREGAEEERETLVELLLTDRDGWDEEDLGDSLGDGAAWRRAEARLLAQRVAELVADRAARPGEVAVLLRAATDAGVFRQALLDVGVPVVAAPSGGFWERQEVADVVAYLAALANPLDEVALCGALASPLGGVSAEALVLLAREVPRGGLAEALLSGETGALREDDRARLEAFRARFAGHREAAPRLRADELVEQVVRDCGYDAYLQGLAGAGERLACVRRLARLGAELELREGRDLRRFADRAAAGALASGGELDGLPGEGEGDAVQLMTIHAAKGLEFPVVCVADLGRRKRTERPLLLTDGRRLGLRLRRLDGGEPGESFDYGELLAEQRRAEAAEEERITYVALTRARERLIVSGAARLDSWPDPNPALGPLSWLAPALLPDLAQRLEQGEPVQEAAYAGHRVLLMRNRPGELLRAAGGARTRLPPPPPPPAAPTGELPRAPAVPPPPAALSYTALSAHASCGYAYYLRRVLGLPDAAPPRGTGGPARLDAAARGRIIHALLERLDMAAPQPPSRDVLSELVRAEGGEASDATLDDLLGLLDLFASSRLRGRLAAAQERFSERAFALRIEGLPLLTGVLDVLAVEPDGGTLVVDYKSDRLFGSEPAAVVEHAYATQRDAYALAALRGGADAVEVAYCFLERPDDLVSARFGAGDVERLEQRLRDAADALLAGRFEVTANPHLELCGTCPGRPSLCSWGPDRTCAPAARASG